LEYLIVEENDGEMQEVVVSHSDFEREGKLDFEFAREDASAG
jgi:hypothetical protein